MFKTLTLSLIKPQTKRHLRVKTIGSGACVFGLAFPTAESPFCRAVFLHGSSGFSLVSHQTLLNNSWKHSETLSIWDCPACGLHEEKMGLKSEDVCGVRVMPWMVRVQDGLPQPCHRLG